MTDVGSNDDPLAFRRRYAGVAPDGMQLDPPFLRTVVVGEPGTIDPYGYWRGAREIDEAGAILVRPDGYIAWRQSTAVWDDAEALHQLKEALTAVLAQPVDKQSGAHPDAPEYTTQPVPITVPTTQPVAGETVSTSGGDR